MAISKLPQVTVWTDGACSTIFVNGQPESKESFGGWGAVLVCGDEKLFLSGSEKQTTNNRMELRAVVSALEQLTRSCTVTLYTDSQYVICGIRTAKLWKDNNWKTKGGTEVKNKDLWSAFLQVSKKHRILPYWVKGHDGNPMNELCDSLAVNARLNLAKENGVATDGSGNSTRAVVEPHIKENRPKPHFFINPKHPKFIQLIHLRNQRKDQRKKLTLEFRERRHALSEEYQKKKKHILA